MNISEYATARGYALEDVKEHITIHHRAKLSEGEIQMLDVALDPSFNQIEAESATSTSGSLENDPEETVIEEVEGEMIDRKSFKPDWCTDIQWMSFNSGVYDKEEKLRKINGI